MPQLTCKELAIGYDGRAVTDSISFSVSKGDYLCIIGENGSGKTTLMKAILGLHPALSGEIILEEGLNRCEIGYLPQQTDLQKDFPASVKEIVYSGCQSLCGLRPFYSKEEKKIAKDAMEKMSISHLAGRCYRELSGGQQQRVLLARALCATQKMLLLDEPVSGLDAKVSAEMYQIIEDLNRHDNITIMMISHDIDAALKYASHILYIGKTIFWGTVDEFAPNRCFCGISSSEGGIIHD